jgi:hypothetical protein
MFYLLSVWKKRHEILVYAFQRDYIAVSGMPETLSRWQSLDKTITFHYVSSMMYQLLPSIRHFFEIVHFPQGSFHVGEEFIKKKIIKIFRCVIFLYIHMD